MYSIRTPAPPRFELCTIAVDGRDRWISIGDVASIVTGMPWLPEMGQTKRRTIGHRQFVRLQALASWCERLMKSEYKEPARELERLVEWAKTVDVAENIPAGKKQP